MGRNKTQQGEPAGQSRQVPAGGQSRQVPPGQSGQVPAGGQSRQVPPGQSGQVPAGQSRQGTAAAQPGKEAKAVQTDEAGTVIVVNSAQLENMIKKEVKVQMVSN